MYFWASTAALVLVGVAVIWAESGSRLQTFLWMAWFIALINWFAVLVAKWSIEFNR